VRAAVSATDTLMSPSPGENIATDDPTRSFPDPLQVAADNTDAASGSCPVVPPNTTTVAPALVECYAEFLPTASYAGVGLDATLHFRLTARDRVAGGGGVGHADVALSLAQTAGPFRVTSQATNGSSLLTGGAPTTVTWDVAQTDLPPVGTTDVKISYSTDGGRTCPTVLAASTPNDGSEAVTVPDTATATGRIKVEAVGNYFYDMNRHDLFVTTSAGATPTPIPSASPTATATATASATATGTATATTTPTASPTATATRTASPTPTYVVPTPTPTPTVVPGRSTVKPSLAPTRRKLKVSRRRIVKLRVRCLVAGVYALPANCRGKARIYTRLRGRPHRVAIKRIVIPRGTTRTVKLRLGAKAFRQLRRHGKLTATAKVRASGRVASKQVTLRIALR
jgi:hypothetical protein